MKTVEVILTLGVTQTIREMKINEKTDNLEAEKLARKKYSSIINAGGALKIQGLDA